MAQRLNNPGTRHFTSTGSPLSGGKLYFYQPGTTTPKDTYSDNELTTPNSNPVVLDSGGLEPNIFLSGAYRVILDTSADVQVWDRDNINSVTDQAFSDWVATSNYGNGGNNIVMASDGNYYVSIQSNNLNNDPTTSPAYWTQITFIRVWNTNETYATDDTVRGSDGVLYRSLTDNNTGNDPVGDNGPNWAIAGVQITSKGVILAGNGTAAEGLSAGTDDHVLTLDSAQPLGLKWAANPYLRQVDTFTSSGTWNKNDKAAFVFVEAWGPGGGGPNNTGSVNIGGASGGEYIAWLFEASALGSSETVTIGTGGSGGADGGNNSGSDGGNTTFGSHLTAIGGKGTVASGGVFATFARAVNPSIPSSENAVLSGLAFPQAGLGGLNDGISTQYGGAGGGGSSSHPGGTSAFGGDGGDGNDTASTKAEDGSAPGGGGGASENDGGGGNGARGEMRVWQW